MKSQRHDQCYNYRINKKQGGRHPCIHHLVTDEQEQGGNRKQQSADQGMPEFLPVQFQADLLLFQQKKYKNG